jgi:folate-binding Fe-S cluster repair protein YgfZ
MSVDSPAQTPASRNARITRSTPEPCSSIVSDRLRMRFSGEKAADSLTGLVTSDVLLLTPGHGQYSAALTPKGKVIADVRIFSRDDGLAHGRERRALRPAGRR